MIRQGVMTCVVAAVATVVAAAPSAAQRPKPDSIDVANAPDGVEMLLPRGGIPAIFEPEFVEAESAGLPDSAWVLGVAIGGEARAYSLNLLNSHEVVNDVIGNRPVAAVW